MKFQRVQASEDDQGFWQMACNWFEKLGALCLFENQRTGDSQKLFDENFSNR